MQGFDFQLKFFTFGNWFPNINLNKKTRKYFMRFALTLTTENVPSCIPINYQYPLSAVIYKIISSADKEYAAFLHNTGYQVANKQFKLFTFSDLTTSFSIENKKMVLRQNEATLIVCFHLSQAAEKFIQGLFLNQQIEIAGSGCKTIFTIHSVMSLPVADLQGGEILVKPLSPLVVGRKNSRGNYDYLAPDAPDYTSLLMNNLYEKYASLQEEITGKKLSLKIEVENYGQPPRSRLITIKAGTAAETKIKGFMNFKLRLRGSPELLELAMNAGMGVYNALGMGCVGEVE